MVLTQLQDVMDKRGISVAELAVKTMLSMRSIESAKSKKAPKGVSLNSAKRIAKALSMKLEDLK